MGMAGRSGRSRDGRRRGQQVIAAYANDADMQGAGEASCRVPGKPYPAGQKIVQPPVEQVPQFLQPLRAVLCQFMAGEVGGGAQAGGQSDVLGAGPQAALLPATGDEGLE